MKKFLMITLLALSTTAFAAEDYVKTTGLSAQQQAEIALQVAKMKSDKSEPVAISETVRHEAMAWTDLGANMGKAMVGAAKEVGVAANEFSQTDLGKVTVAIVAYKIVGKDVLAAVLGTGILVFGMTMAAWILTTRRWSEVTYERIPVMWGAFTVKRVIKSDTSGDVVAGKLIGAGVCFGLTLLVGLKTIF